MDIKEIGPDGLPIIFWRMKQDDKKTVERLLDAGADIEAKGYHGSTPVLSAAMVGDWVMAELLIKRGADITIVDKRGFNLPYLLLESTPVVGSKTDQALNRVREILKTHGMLEKVYKPIEIRELMKSGQWPLKAN